MKGHYTPEIAEDHIVRVRLDEVKVKAYEQSKSVWMVCAKYRDRDYVGKGRSGSLAAKDWASAAKWGSDF